jgi:Oxaloacetate decarboxylase, gamma chain.
MGTFELTDIITAAGVVIAVVLLVMLGMMIHINSKIGAASIQKSAASAPVAQYDFSASNDGIPGEIVAVIAAAVASMYEGTGTAAVLKSVRRSEIGLPIWGKAGLMENTRPF